MGGRSGSFKKHGGGTTRGGGTTSLSALKGSEKQIKWAKDIRDKFKKSIEELEKVKGMPDSDFYRNARILANSGSPYGFPEPPRSRDMSKQIASDRDLSVNYLAETSAEKKKAIAYYDKLEQTYNKYKPKQQGNNRIRGSQWSEANKKTFIDMAKDKLANEDNASWWIDHR